MPEIKRIEPGRRFSEAVVCDGVVYISGQVDLARNRDPKVQTAEVLKTIDDLLAKAGSDKEHILHLHCLLVEYGLLFRDESGLGRMGEQNQSPARSVLESALPDPSWKVQISTVAVVVD